MNNYPRAHSDGNWHNNSGANNYHYMGNGGNPSHGSWASNGRGGRLSGGRGNGDDNTEQFRKFRDNHVGRRRDQDGNLLKLTPKERKMRAAMRKAKRDGGGRNGGGRNGGGRSSGVRGGGGGGRVDRADYNAVGPWPQENIPSDMYYFTQGQQRENTGTPSLEPPITPTREPLITPVSEPPIIPALEAAAPTIAMSTESEHPTAVIDTANIKKEKKDSLPKQPLKKEESSEDSSSSSDDSSEAGEVKKPNLVPVKKTEVPVPQTTKAKTEAITKPTTSSDDSSSDDSTPPAKTKSLATESKTLTKSLKKTTSDDDVVCLGNDSRKFVVTDDEEDDDEEENMAKVEKAKPSSKAKSATKLKDAKGKEKTNLKCGICLKKGHTSFECQMICRNCAEPYHSLKNCPNPPNLNIALQAFMEFTMQQLTMFNMEKRFAFPAGVVTEPSLPPVSTPNTPVTTKSKKHKRAAVKKKKSLKKKIKVETHDSDDDEDDEDDDDNDDNEDDDDEEDEADTTSESESSGSSNEKPTASIKAKRKRGSKVAKTLPVANMQAAAAFPFPYSLPPGASYNSLMYPYGAAFNFPK